VLARGYNDLGDAIDRAERYLALLREALKALRGEGDYASDKAHQELMRTIEEATE